MTAFLKTWLIEPMSEDVRQSLERWRQRPDVTHVAVMPDVHLSKEVCVGTVLATTRTIYPAAIGSDIGCGVAALRISINAELLDDERRAAAILRGLYERVPAIRHRKPPKMPEELSASIPANAIGRRLEREACAQFGTLGSGNHFLEFQSAEDGLWLMVHSGSRAMGEAIRDWHLGQLRDEGVDVASDAGRAYLADMNWALKYAQSSRRAMLEAASDVCLEVAGVKADWTTLIDCQHNTVTLEACRGTDLWVHRKGAIPAHFGEPGLIPGSMGTPSYHVCGRGHEEALCSCSHGAGRKFSRGEARKLISVRKFEREMEGVWFDHRRSNQLIDEAPGAYKDIGQVMRAQHELTRIVRELTPVLSYKGK